MINSAIENTVELMRKIYSNSYQSLLSIATSFLALLTPAVPIIMTAIAFILADTYYGYQVSKKYGHKLESNKLWKLCTKIKDTFLVLVLGLLLDKYILGTYEQLAAVKIAAGSVCIAEGISLLESFRALHPRALLSKLLAKLIKSKAEKYLDVDLSDIISLNEFTDDTYNKDIDKQI